MLINFFITFLLLELTAKLAKKELNIYRALLASFLGSLYSLIIFADGIPEYILNITKLFSAMLIVIVSFKFVRLSQYIKCVLIYFFSSLIFLGITVGACFLFQLKFVAINNSVIYFNISALNIIVCAAISYLISSIILRIYNRTLSKKELYTLIIIHADNKYYLNAFLDTGNKLREPFSDMPVIIVDKSKLNIDLDEQKIRLIPVTTVNGTDMLKSFKPDKIIIKSSSGKEVIENAYIAFSDNISDKNYSAILNSSILSV